MSMKMNEVFIHDDKNRCSITFIDGQPFESEVEEWVAEYGNPKKITVEPFEGKAYTVYENGQFMNCRADFM